MAAVRNQLYLKGYALYYTGGVMRTAKVWKRQGLESYEVDMSDPVKGWEELQRLADSL